MSTGKKPKTNKKPHKRVFFFFALLVIFSEPLLTKDFAGLQTNQGMRMKIHVQEYNTLY